MQQLKAEQPTDTYPGFKKEIIAEIARCLSMPFGVAAGDSSAYNYSSGRLDRKTYYKSLTVERGEIERVALGRIFSRWFAEGRLIRGYLPDQFFRGDEPRHEWRWPGDEHIDPTKEADATETRIAIGISSYPDECAKLGNDYEMVHAKNAAALGLTVEAYRARLADRLLGPVAMPPQAPAKPQADSEDPEEGADDGEE